MQNAVFQPGRNQLYSNPTADREVAALTAKWSWVGGGIAVALSAAALQVGAGVQEAAATPQTAFAYNRLCLEHRSKATYPESPGRLEAILKRMETAGFLAQLLSISPRPDAAEWLTAVHSAEYVKRASSACHGGAQYLDCADMPICAASYRAAVGAVGTVLSAVDAVAEGKVRNAFCAVRPPGHHALKDGARGFCMFNNVAIAARYAQKAHGLSRVLIVDWDVHHGNGTQEAFYHDPTVLYLSVHREGIYPGTGSRAERGEGAGLGYTINIPMQAGAGDADYLKALREELLPAAESFRPDLVLISAGFDAHQADPLGGMKVTTEGFAQMTRLVKSVAETHCQGRLVSVLEGGYNVKSLAECVEAHVRVLMESGEPAPEEVAHAPQPALTP